MSENNKKEPTIKSLFETKQALLESKLSVILGHPVTKGDHCEGAWIEFFRSFLPSRYAVDKGFVFDAKGNVSEQIDIIIYDALYSPLIFETDAGEKFITAESVYAIFESKDEITEENLEYADKKIASVTRLMRSSRYIVSAGESVPARDLPHILGGILAVKSIGPETIKKHVANTPNIDIGCGIKKTAFIVHRDSDGKFIDVDCSAPEESILAFFYIVLDTLHSIGTVAAIDIRDYADSTLDSIKLQRSNDTQEKGKNAACKDGNIKS